MPPSIIDGQVDVAGDRHLKELKWLSAPVHQSRNEDIRISCDAKHSAIGCFTFAAHFFNKSRNVFFPNPKRKRSCLHLLSESRQTVTCEVFTDGFLDYLRELAVLGNRHFLNELEQVLGEQSVWVHGHSFMEKELIREKVTFRKLRQYSTWLTA